MYYYDPFFSPGTTIYVQNYNDYWSYRRWQRWQRWNSWRAYDYYGYNSGWNSWGWSSCYSNYNPWYNPWVINNYYYDPYWTWNGYNPYYGNYWSNNNYYYNNNSYDNGGGYRPQTYTGPRRHGSHVNPGYARIADGNGRLTTTEKAVPTIEKTSRLGSGRLSGDMEPSKPPTRTNAPTTTGTAPSRQPSKDPRVENPREVEKPSAPRSTRPETRTPETTPSRGTEPATRKDDGYVPRRTEETPRSREVHAHHSRRFGLHQAVRRTETRLLPETRPDTPRRFRLCPSPYRNACNRNPSSTPCRRAQLRTFTHRNASKSH
jgi:hypothetical protein